MKEVQALLYKFGPLHENRYKITEHLRHIPLQTGDILYRFSDAKGPFGLPFGKLVGRLTKSVYSHAAIVYLDKSEIYVLEVNDQGTLKFRMVDWLDACATKEFSVYRLKEFNFDLIDKIGDEICKIWKEDPDYDFTFSDSNKFYCTESVAAIYQNVGIQLVEPQYIKEIVPFFKYWLLAAGSWFVSLFSDCKLPLNVKCYYVGNETQGLMSSEKTELIFHFKE